MNYELRTNKGFTLIELVVAIALLGMVLGFSGVIFKTSIEAYRTAGANSEIMQKLRSITDQLNSDFKGLQKDAPLLIWFQQDVNVAEPSRYDQIMFFANGDFQTVRYPVPVSGNVARVYYGQATVNSILPWAMTGEYKRDRTLARRQHILTSDPVLVNFPVNNMGNFEPLVFTNTNNDYFEYDKFSLSQWKVVSSNSTFNDTIIITCFDNCPEINIQGVTGLHMLLSQGVGSFSIQWAYGPPVIDKYQWWPSVDPDGDGVIIDSDFEMMNMDEFGIFFKMPGGVSSAPNWYGPEGAKIQTGWTFAGFYPKALKFTFTLYDSKGIIKNGRTFTHIVYLD